MGEIAQAPKQYFPGTVCELWREEAIVRNIDPASLPSIFCPPCSPKPTHSDSGAGILGDWLRGAEGREKETLSSSKMDIGNSKAKA